MVYRRDFVLNAGGVCSLFLQYQLRNLLQDLELPGLFDIPLVGRLVRLGHRPHLEASYH